MKVIQPQMMSHDQRMPTAHTGCTAAAPQRRSEESRGENAGLSEAGCFWLDSFLKVGGAFHSVAALVNGKWLQQWDWISLSAERKSVWVCLWAKQRKRKKSVCLFVTFVLNLNNNREPRCDWTVVLWMTCLCRSSSVLITSD